MTRLHELWELGQSVWLDYISRSLTAGGRLAELVEEGVRGVTSNPSIFEKAISGSADYDDDLRRLAREGKTTEEIYEELVLSDIRRAADILLPLYEESSGRDGYVSLEVSPTLASDRAGTVADGRRLFSALERPNIMIKVPATPAGFGAIEDLISAGVNVNATLIFSLVQYQAVAEAYLRGLERLREAGGDVGRIASVASFFISRIDTAVDRELEKIGEKELAGKIAVASGKSAYSLFRKIFSGESWESLAANGGRKQRPLWASTSTKNPAYPDTLYVDSLIGPETVNTIPPATLEAFLDHGRAALTIEDGMEEARSLPARLEEAGVDLDKINRKLLEDGVAAFAQAFEVLLSGIDGKKKLFTALA